MLCKWGPCSKPVPLAREWMGSAEYCSDNCIFDCLLMEKTINEMMPGLSYEQDQAKPKNIEELVEEMDRRIREGRR